MTYEEHDHHANLMSGPTAFSKLRSINHLNNLGFISISSYFPFLGFCSIGYDNLSGVGPDCQVPGAKWAG